MLIGLSLSEMFCYCFVSKFTFANSVKYLIKPGGYLIEAPPKVPPNSYLLFLKSCKEEKKKMK